METFKKKSEVEAGLKAKNDYRDEVAESQVSPEDEIRRNQNVHLLQLRTRKKMTAADQKHVEGAILEMESAQTALGLMLDCEMKALSLAYCEQQIEALQKQIEQNQFGLANTISLSALEELRKLRDQVETIES